MGHLSKEDLPPQPFTPQGCTNLKLRQLMRRVALRYDFELAKAGIKATQYSLLSHVYQLGPISLGQLAKEMLISPSTLTRNMKLLIDAQWLVLEAAGGDGRSRIIRITPAGITKRQEARACWKHAQDLLNQQLGTAQVAQLHQTIDGLLAQLH